MQGFGIEWPTVGESEEGAARSVTVVDKGGNVYRKVGKVGFWDFRGFFGDIFLTFFGTFFCTFFQPIISESRSIFEISTIWVVSFYFLTICLH